ncbi:MAG: hypothetical protein R3348_01950 [Xanthomonadales bacterium]|nr:hypothetical protein [Xanthomonadales bacterium]
MDDSLLFFTGAFVFGLMVIGVTFTVLEFKQLARKDRERTGDREHVRERL